jgi:hypothetical protein
MIRMAHHSPQASFRHRHVPNHRHYLYLLPSPLLEHIQISKYRDKAHQLESMMLYDIYLFLSIEKFLEVRRTYYPG